MKDITKRLIDIIFSLLLIVVLSPILLLIYVLSCFALGYPPVFKQERPGREGKIFTMYKFRSMSNAKDKDGILLPDHTRLTEYGKFLRKTSLDELPELFNIFKGDMSFVGPRPLLIQYLDRYTPEQSRRHEVRPGLTGWAQVNGRNSIGWEEKFRLDVWYVDNQTIWLDIKIIVMTIIKVLKRSDISAEGEATMGEFMGSKEVQNP